MNTIQRGTEPNRKWYWCFDDDTLPTGPFDIEALAMKDYAICIRDMKLLAAQWNIIVEQDA